MNKNKTLPDRGGNAEDEQILNAMMFAFDDILWDVVVRALKDKYGQTEFMEGDDAPMTDYFKDVWPGFVVKDVTSARNRKKGEVKTLLTVPESWRSVYAKEYEKIEDGRERLTAFYDFANAAINLYGAVSGDDLAEIMDYWWDSAKWLYDGPPGEADRKMRREACGFSAGLAMTIVHERQSSPFAVGYVQDSLAISYNKYWMDDAGKSLPEALRETLTCRQGKKRWYPGTLDEFLEWADPEMRDWPPEYDKLEKFITSTWKFNLNDADELEDLDGAMEAAHDVLAAGRKWREAIEAVRPYLDFSGLSPDVMGDMAAILCECSNATRNDCNWGYTPNEMVKENGIGGVFDMEIVPGDFMRNSNAPIVRGVAKVGRNDMCPCGSGKKYKKCCGKGGTDAGVKGK